MNSSALIRCFQPELLVQHPTKFETVLNFKTAKAPGLDVPLQLQQPAYEVIE